MHSMSTGGTIKMSCTNSQKVKEPKKSRFEMRGEKKERKKAISTSGAHASLDSKSDEETFRGLQ